MSRQCMTLVYVAELNRLARAKTGRDWVRVDKSTRPLSYVTSSGHRIEHCMSVSATRRAIAYMVGVLGEVDCTFDEQVVINRAVLEMPRMWIHVSMRDMVELGVRDIRCS